MFFLKEHTSYINYKYGLSLPLEGRISKVFKQCLVQLKIIIKLLNIQNVTSWGWEGVEFRKLLIILNPDSNKIEYNIIRRKSISDFEGWNFEFPKNYLNSGIYIHSPNKSI